MKTIKKTYQINAPVEKVWEALVMAKVINQWGGGPAKMDEKEGTEFSLWGGDIHGTNTEIISQKKLVQEWFGGNWDEASLVTFTLKNQGQKTKVTLLHEKIPDRDAQDIEKGWDEYYMGPLQEFVEGE
ncbi:MAG TPA: SRPBCC domain-containing protein [Methylomirabilota bacterium]|nr:SRPBCC domain-containing protein [Methylomirabilota bacterium]